ncbi:MAG: alpha/beta hydrolase [Hydrogenophaga sp.]
MSTPALHTLDPDGQPPLPPMAVDYARTVTDWAQVPLDAPLTATLDQAYGAHRLQRFDVFAPKGAQNAPVLVFWHGGGWTNGYRQWVHFMAPHVTALGMVLVAPSYRLTPDHPLPAAQDDALALLAHLHAGLPQWGGSPKRVYLSGHSAGGHVAAMAALKRQAWRTHGVADDMIQGCLPISGIMDLHDPQPAPQSLEERVYTTVLRGLDPLQDAVHSPLYWTAGNRVPFDLSVGENDSARVLRSNRRMLPLLLAQQATATLHEAPGLDHFHTHLQLRDPACPWYAQLARRVHAHTESA